MVSGIHERFFSLLELLFGAARPVTITCSGGQPHHLLIVKRFRLHPHFIVRQTKIPIKIPILRTTFAVCMA
ncbi:hypothetical protein EDB89DRAFT_1947645 [Lactarius sanguifluus]|nr:hypothetical protein EDB89DRAFT_2010315 [Lactarius sanguifluus]KAH9175105.1 hypothetical protein EDB89DRAFT_1947645 [Lactarius sanguifluus]